MTLPWVSFFYIENISQAPLTFTLRKFIENPSIIALLISLNLAFNFMVGVFTSYMSDRIWTRWGRRRPFLMIGWSGVAVSMFFVPLAPNAWALAGIIVVYQFCADIAKPLEALSNEVVPPPQRGRWATMRNIAQNLMNMFFYGVMIAQFDRIYDLETLGRKIQLRGETVLYWSGCAIILVAVAFLAFFVKETPPAGTIVRERFAWKAFLREIFGQRQWWTVYLLYAVPIIAIPGINELEPLMRTEQLGFSKSDYGKAAALGQIINVALFIPIAGYLTDKMPRLRLLQIGLLAYAMVNFGFFLYLRYVANYQIPLSTLIAISSTALVFKTCVYVVWAPLVYDYIPSDRFGTVSAGFAFVGGILPFILINLVGAWINGFTSLFGTRGNGNFDYSSIYVFQLIAALGAFALTRYIRSEEKGGGLIRYGQLEAENAARRAAAAKPAN
jgi:MFS family permease